MKTYKKGDEMLTREILTSNGYDQFHCSWKDGANIGYQKLIKDVQGKKYFINIYEWYFFQFREYTGPLVSYSVECRLTDVSGFEFDLHFNADSLSIHQVEEFCEKIWTVNSCLYYKKEESTNKDEFFGNQYSLKADWFEEMRSNGLRYFVLKADDLFNALSEDDVTTFNKFLRTIEAYRKQLGKHPSNKYYVVNRDESYSEEIKHIIEDHVGVKL